MSSETAIASITLALMQGLQQAIDAVQDLSADVVSEYPDKVSNTGRNTVNVYMFQAQVNAYLRNNDLKPEVIPDPGNGPAQLIYRSTMPLVLHYALSYHGDHTALVPQRLLSVCVAALNQKPLIEAKALTAIAHNEYPNAVSHPIQDWEDVKIEVLPSSLEESYRLWSALRAPYALSTMLEARSSLVQGTPMERDAYLVRDIDIVTKRKDGPKGPP